MSWANELAAELLCRPMGLVALTGLDVKNNAVHLSVWDAFCNNRRSDRVPLQFKLFPADHEYPKAKSKRTSYEWYIPKGILKTFWMNKLLTAVPAVQVIFFDLDWDEPMWKEKQMQCSTRVEIVRNGLQHRGTKVVVVLIQKNAPLPPGEDVVAAERAASLCSACDLSAKSLYVLPHTDHLIGYIIRLENAFYESAQGYYHSEARKVKAHKDFLNKTTHQLLFVRHQFKIAFFNELKQDSHTALKHYKQAYGHVLELRMHDTNILEVKTIAGFISYKICRLSFQHNAPLDSIAQFRKHIDFFKSKTGISDLAFEHSAWMSKQFQLFGDLFDEAIKRGLTAIQTQHPGFYYQQAANHAIARKQLCRGLCKPTSSSVNKDVIDQLYKLDFYGQRPWRQGHQSIDPPDQTKEKEGIVCLQSLELKEDHSLSIIPLLSSAVAQFKKYKSPRMKRYLMVQMGEEYFDSKDYNKALMLLTKVLWDYRVERWWPLLTCILETSLKCAYITAKIQEYTANCLELVGSYTRCSIEEKTRIQMNLIRVLSNDVPEAEPALDQNSLERAKSNWLTVAQEPQIITIEMQNIVSFVECKCRFTKDKFYADSEIEVEVYLRVTCPFPMRFSKLSVTFNNQDCNEFCEVIDGHGVSADSEKEPGTGDLYLVPGNIKVQKFAFLANKSDLDQQIEIKSVCLEIASVTGRCTRLHWTGCGGDSIGSPQLLPSGLKRTHKKTEEIFWDQIVLYNTTKILPRVSQLKILLEHQPPALVNEFYHIAATITNNENSLISNVCVSFGLQDTTDSPSTDQSTHVRVDTAEFDGKIVPGITDLHIGTVQASEKVKKNFYIKCLYTGSRNLLLKMSYNVEITKGSHTIVCYCKQQETLALSAVTPLEVSFKLESLKFEAIEVVHADEPFLLLPEIRCIAPWPVEIKTSSLQLTPFIQGVDETISSQVEEIHLKKNESASECLCLISQGSNPPSVTLGSYTVHWKRQSASGDDIPHVLSVFPLPTVSIEHIPVSVHLVLPAMGSVKKLLPLCYTIKNKTGYIQEIEATMDSSDSFMFSGNKLIHFRVLPSRDYQLTYNLFPLVAGHMMLPKLHINMTRYPGTMDQIVQKSLPSHIFIKPLAKNRGEN